MDVTIEQRKSARLSLFTTTHNLLYFVPVFNTELLKNRMDECEQIVFNSSKTNVNMYNATIKSILFSLHIQATTDFKTLNAYLWYYGLCTLNQILKSEMKEIDNREFQRRVFAKLIFSIGSDNYASVATELEKECYNFSIVRCTECEELQLRSWSHGPFKDIYFTKCGYVCSLLIKESYKNQYDFEFVVSRILNNTILPKNIVNKHIDHICPAIFEGEHKTIDLRNNQTVEEKPSIMFKCPHCGERNCTYQTVQKRAADEAPDYKCFCLSCKKKFNGRN